MTKIIMLSWKPLLKIEVERENSGFRRKFPDINFKFEPPAAFGHLWPFSLAFSTLQYIRERKPGCQKVREIRVVRSTRKRCSVGCPEAERDKAREPLSDRVRRPLRTPEED